MNSLKYILIGVLISIISASCSSLPEKNSSKQQVITLQSLSTSFPRELLSESSVIIAKRLGCLNINNFTIEENIDQSQLIITFNERVDIQYLSELLPVQGRLNYLETYKREDVVRNLQKAVGLSCIQSIDSLLGVTSKDNRFPDAVLGSAAAKDTSTINRCLSSNIVKSLLPAHIKFFWSKYVTESNRLELFAISSDNSGINETALKDACVSKDAKHNAISMTFKEDYWSAWENLTKKSIDKSIAFVLDQRVYSAPKVCSVISGGKVEITGNFSENEANRLVAIISCGKLPLGFQIK